MIRLSVLLLAAAAIGLAVLPARAFTVENKDSAGQTKNFLDLDTKKAPDPDQDAKNFSDGKTTFKQGNFSLQFGNQRSFNQRFNENDMFDTFKRDGRE